MLGFLKRVIAQMMTDEEFLAEVEQAKKRLYGFARRNLYSQNEVEDVFSEAILSAWSQRAQFEPGSSFSAWIFRILLNKIYIANRRIALSNKAVAHFQSLGSEVSSQGGFELEAHPLEKALEGCEDGLKRALMRLNETERESFLLLTLGGLSYAEIAAATGAPVTTVITRLSRARTKLRLMLEQKEIRELKNRRES